MFKFLILYLITLSLSTNILYTVMVLLGNIFLYEGVFKWLMKLIKIFLFVENVLD